MNRWNQTRLSLNWLEDRSVPAVVASMSQGTLFVGGSPTNPGSAIRIDGQSNPVRVFDGTKMIGAFDQVKSIDARPEPNANLHVDLGTARSFDSVAVTVTRGVNTIRLTGGIVGKVAFVGSNGNDRITVGGLKTSLLTADVGLGTDELRVGRSQIDAVIVNAAEKIDLASSELNRVDLVNQTASMNVNSIATIKDYLAVNQNGGTLDLGGLVGDVSYLNARSASASTLNVNGTIAGSLIMVGTELNDVVNLAKGAQIFGPVSIKLGGMDDHMTLGGMIGRKNAPTKLLVDMGSGNDQLMVLQSAVIHGFSEIAMGAGRDLASIAKHAYFTWLKIDGGADADTLEAPIGQNNLSVSNFEVVAG